jgi:hypothetical protein
VDRFVGDSKTVFPGGEATLQKYFLCEGTLSHKSSPLTHAHEPIPRAVGAGTPYLIYLAILIWDIQTQLTENLAITALFMVLNIPKLEHF